MFSHKFCKHTGLSLLAALLALTFLPFSALAVTENVLESAPEVTVTEAPADAAGAEESRDEYDYMPYSPFITSENETLSESEQLNQPRLTDAEMEKYREIKAAREAGEKLLWVKQDFLAPERVKVAGVYPLDPAEYAGETFYVILPDRQMDRSDLQNLMAAFDQLGISFDPDSLNFRNCARGSSLASGYSSRELSYEEQLRMDTLRALIRRGKLDSETVVPDYPFRTALVHMPGYEKDDYYFTPFCFFPYRSMTDNELAAFALMKEEKWEIDPDRIEKISRESIHSLLRVPFLMTLRNETRSEYSQEHIEYGNYFSVDAEESAFPDEIPVDIYVEHVARMNGSEPEAVVSRLSFDYPASYEYYEDSGSDGSGAVSGRQAVCSKEELKAAAQRWMETNLLIPAESVQTDWTFAKSEIDEGIVQLTMLTHDWVIVLELLSSNARYYGCDISRLSSYAGSGAAEADVSGWEIDPAVIEKASRECAYSLVRLPENITLTDMHRATHNNVDSIEYVDYFETDIWEAGGMYGSLDETPYTLFVEHYYHSDPVPGTDIVRLSVDYPADYWSRPVDPQAECSEKELRAAAEQWVKDFLLIPVEKDPESWYLGNEYAYSEECVAFIIPAYDWILRLQIRRSDAKYVSCDITNRKYSSLDNELAEPVDDTALIDQNARQFVYGILNLPVIPAAENIKDESPRSPRYRCDYTLDTAESSGEPGQLIIYQDPDYRESSGLHVDLVFITYHAPAPGAEPLDCLSAARQWAAEYLLIPQDKILEDWSLDPANSSVHQRCILRTADLDIYLDINTNGQCVWTGIYPH